MILNVLVSNTGPRVPEVGDVVDLFEPAPRVGTVVKVHNATALDIVDSDGTVHTSVTLGRKKHGWGWPEPLELDAPAGAIASGNVITDIKAG